MSDLSSRSTKIPASLEELRALVARTASAAKVGGEPSGDPLASCLGLVRAAAPDEAWPTFEGQPMLGVAQLNLREAPFVPPALSDVALITFFLAAHKGEDGLEYFFPAGRRNGEGWVLRAYDSIEGLVAMPAAYDPGWLSPRGITWERIEDLPDEWGQGGAHDLVDFAAIEEILGEDDWNDAVGRPADATKLGGWPSVIGDDSDEESPARKATFCLQIDSDLEVGLDLWDGGVIHIGSMERAGRKTWVIESQRE